MSAVCRAEVGNWRAICSLCVRAGVPVAMIRRRPPNYHGADDLMDESPWWICPVTDKRCDHGSPRVCEVYTCAKNDAALLRVEGGSTEGDE